MNNKITRRELLGQAALLSGVAALGGVWTEGAQAQSKSPNEKLNVACIGVGGQGGSDLGQIGGHPAVNIVAMADVDAARAADSFKAYPNAVKYQDFRRLLDKEQKHIDAVVVSTPDHCHAPASVMAMKLGKHVYCQKPLAHSVQEARIMMETARKHKVVTQMGTQGHPSYARSVELVQAGVIGEVREVHVITDRPKGWWPQGVTKPAGSAPVPATLAWDLWLGPAAERPYNPAYLPFVWRGWWDFGTGALGDMACHLMDAPFWALKLKYPTAVEATGEGGTADSPPTAAMIHYDFPQRGDLPPVRVTWYDGGNRPSAEVLEGTTLAGDFNGSLFVGSQGKMLVTHGSTEPTLLPADKFKDMTLPEPTIPRVRSHYTEWILACKDGGTTGSNFDYAAPMTEAILLGNVSLRVGKKLEYDARSLKAVNCPEAEQFIRSHYRKGYSL